MIKCSYILSVFYPTGTIPNWLEGYYLRVGPGKFELGDTTLNHFIDGYAMLSKFDIQDGKVSPKSWVFTIQYF